MEAMEEVLTGTATILSLTATILPSCIYATLGVDSEALVVCSEHVGSTPEQANAVLPVRLPLFGLVTRGVAEKE